MPMAKWSIRSGNTTKRRHDCFLGGSETCVRTSQRVARRHIAAGQRWSHQDVNWPARVHRNARRTETRLFRQGGQGWATARARGHVEHEQEEGRGRASGRSLGRGDGDVGRSGTGSRLHSSQTITSLSAFLPDEGRILHS